LRGKSVIFADHNNILHAPKTGAMTNPLIRTLVRAQSRVTALHVTPSRTYWGELSGWVRYRSTAGVTTVGGAPGLPTSTATNSMNRAAWTSCADNACRLRYMVGSNVRSLQALPNAHGASFGISGQVFWGDDRGIFRRTLP
jgi:hypothetical protein